MSGKWCCTMVLLSAAAVGYCAESEFVTLETIRLFVARNEALLNPIKMAYTVKKSWTGERPQPTRGPRPGRRYSHVNCVWAQAGDKHYAREDYFYGPNEAARSTVKVIEPECVTEGILPDLMKGTIGPRGQYDWYSVQAVQMDDGALRKWVSEENIPFPVGMIQGDEECVRFDWAVYSLPWLILTDREHIIQAEGFGLDHLDKMIEEMNNVAR